MKIRPLADRLLVQPEQEEVSKGGIVIPDVAKEKDTRGVVVAVGPGRHAERGGARLPMTAQVGDRVLFGKFAGTEIDVEGVPHRILREEDCMAIVEGAA